MRLPKVHHGHRFRQKLFLGLVRIMSGHTAPGVMRTLLYRRELFGGRQSEITQQVMRGPSAWAVGERELMAAYVSKVNQCEF